MTNPHQKEESLSTKNSQQLRGLGLRLIRGGKSEFPGEELGKAKDGFWEWQDAPSPEMFTFHAPGLWRACSHLKQLFEKEARRRPQKRFEVRSRSS